MNFQWITWVWSKCSRGVCINIFQPNILFFCVTVLVRSGSAFKQDRHPMSSQAQTSHRQSLTEDLAAKEPDISLGELAETTEWKGD